LEEVKESKATSAGITGGDPLINFEKTLEFATKLKKYFGKKFHIHIYLPTKFVTNGNPQRVLHNSCNPTGSRSSSNLEKLSKCVDEVRFHPDFLIDSKKVNEDFEKIKLASLFWKKKNIGIELPMIPEKKEEVLNFILKMEKFVSFVNLNEFELSETNFNLMTKKYKLNEGGYVVAGSLEAGEWILDELKKNKSKLKMHLCTAELKNCSQFANRLKLHKILPYGKKTKDGTVIYLIVNKKLNLKNTFYDEKKNRTILSGKIAKRLLNKEKIFRVEEYPTYDRIEVEKEEL
jgi:hypothetical protein